MGIKNNDDFAKRFQNRSRLLDELMNFMAILRILRFLLIGATVTLGYGVLIYSFSQSIWTVAIGYLIALGIMGLIVLNQEWTTKKIVVMFAVEWTMKRILPIIAVFVWMCCLTYALSLWRNYD